MAATKPAENLPPTEPTTGSNVPDELLAPVLEILRKEKQGTETPIEVFNRLITPPAKPESKDVVVTEDSFPWEELPLGSATVNVRVGATDSAYKYERVQEVSGVIEHRSNDLIQSFTSMVSHAIGLAGPDLERLPAYKDGAKLILTISVE